jgi:hypothetical protein
MPTIPGKNGSTALLGWHLQNNVWNPESLVEGTDYSVSFSYDANNLADRPTWNWQFPVKGAWYSVHSYAEIMFGGSPWWDAGTSADPLGVFPVAVSDLSSLTMRYDVSLAGNTDGYNIAFELWLGTKNGDGTTTMSNEIMVWFHHGGFLPGGSVVGSYTGTDYSGTIYNQLIGRAAGTTPPSCRPATI